MSFTPKTIKLDVKDLKLLKELETNSMESLSFIAKRTGMSKEVAHYRYNRLMQEGLIKKFAPIIDYFKIGYKLYRLIIDLENLKREVKKTIVSELRKMNNIELVVYLSSNWDLEINMWVRNSRDFYNFYDKFLEKYSEYIANKELYIVTRLHIINNGHIHGNNYEVILGEETERIEIDNVDKRIITLLEQNPKEDIIAMSKTLEIATSTLSYRIKQLKKNKIIKGYFPVLDSSLLGFNKFKVEVTLNHPAKKKQIISYLATQKNITKIAEIIGHKDIDFDVDFKTTVQLDMFLERLRAEIPEIKNFEVKNIITD